MKKLFIAFLLLFPFVGMSQMKNALDAGNALEASKYMAPVVEVKWMGEETESLSSLNFTNKLKGLFEKCETVEFKVLHVGQADLGTQYIMGELSCGEQIYSVTYYFITKNSIDLVEQFILEEK